MSEPYPSFLDFLADAQAIAPAASASTTGVAGRVVGHAAKELLTVPTVVPIRPSVGGGTRLHTALVERRYNDASEIIFGSGSMGDKVEVGNDSSSEARTHDDVPTVPPLPLATDEAVASINAYDFYGLTPLHLAIMGGAPMPLIKAMVLIAGANPHQPTYSGTTLQVLLTYGKANYTPCGALDLTAKALVFKEPSLRGLQAKMQFMKKRREAAQTASQSSGAIGGSAATVDLSSSTPSASNVAVAAMTNISPPPQNPPLERLQNAPVFAPLPPSPAQRHAAMATSSTSNMASFEEPLQHQGEGGVASDNCAPSQPHIDPMSLPTAATVLLTPPIASPTADGGGQADTTSPPKAAATITREASHVMCMPLRCNGGHALVTNNYGPWWWSCDDCKTDGGFGMSLQCRVCRYDRCLSCVVAQCGLSLQIEHSATPTDCIVSQSQPHDALDGSALPPTGAFVTSSTLTPYGTAPETSVPLQNHHSIVEERRRRRVGIFYRSDGRSGDAVCDESDCLTGTSATSSNTPEVGDEEGKGRGGSAAAPTVVPYEGRRFAYYAACDVCDITFGYRMGYTYTYDEKKGCGDDDADGNGNDGGVGHVAKRTLPPPAPPLSPSSTAFTTPSSYTSGGSATGSISSISGGCGEGAAGSSCQLVGHICGLCVMRMVNEASSAPPLASTLSSSGGETGTQRRSLEHPLRPHEGRHGMNTTLLAAQLLMSLCPPLAAGGGATAAVAVSSPPPINAMPYFPPPHGHERLLRFALPADRLMNSQTGADWTGKPVASGDRGHGGRVRFAGLPAHVARRLGELEAELIAGSRRARSQPPPTTTTVNPLIVKDIVLELLRFFVEDCGVSIYGRDRAGFTLGHHAVGRGLIEVVEYLRKRERAAEQVEAEARDASIPAIPTATTTSRMFLSPCPWWMDFIATYRPTPAEVRNTYPAFCRAERDFAGKDKTPTSNAETAIDERLSTPRKANDVTPPSVLTVPNPTGLTPLHLAVLFFRATMVKYLVEECGVDVDSGGEAGNTSVLSDDESGGGSTNVTQPQPLMAVMRNCMPPPIFLATWQHSPRIVKLLLALGASVNGRYWQEDTRGGGLLHVAAYANTALPALSSALSSATRVDQQQHHHGGEQGAGALGNQAQNQHQQEQQQVPSGGTVLRRLSSNTPITVVLPIPNLANPSGGAGGGGAVTVVAAGRVGDTTAGSSSIVSQQQPTQQTQPQQQPQPGGAFASFEQAYNYFNALGGSSGLEAEHVDAALLCRLLIDCGADVTAVDAFGCMAGFGRKSKGVYRRPRNRAVMAVVGVDDASSSAVSIAPPRAVGGDVMPLEEWESSSSSSSSSDSADDVSDDGTTSSASSSSSDSDDDGSSGSTGSEDSGITTTVSEPSLAKQEERANFSYFNILMAEGQVYAPTAGAGGKMQGGIN